MISLGLQKLRFPGLRLGGPRTQKDAKPAERGVKLQVIPGTNAVAPGARLGRYELLSPLGAGGMAEVFKARTMGPGGFERTVVIKRILPGQQQDEEFVRMFMDEAKLLGMLHHPNIVQALEFGDEGGTFFLAQEFVDGPTVSRLLRTMRAAGRKIPPAIAAYIAREVCHALAYAHGLSDATGVPLNVVHRDVTPSNIVLTLSGGVKLLDFGVAKFSTAEQATRAGTVKGKPAYLAPEQLQGKTIDGRVDVFALGIVLHEMLSLEHLFAGDSDLVTVKKIMEMEIPAPSEKRPDISPELDRIVMRALERSRRKRYGSAAEMARDLDGVVLAAGLRHEEVVAFIAEIEAEANRQVNSRPLRLVTPLPVELPPKVVAGVADGIDQTERGVGLGIRLARLVDGLRGRSRALLAGVMLLMAAAVSILALAGKTTASVNVHDAGLAALAVVAPAVDTTSETGARAPQGLWCTAETALEPICAAP